jgi:hypothetical protein
MPCHQPQEYRGSRDEEAVVKGSPLTDHGRKKKREKKKIFLAVIEKAFDVP